MASPTKPRTDSEVPGESSTSDHGNLQSKIQEQTDVLPSSTPVEMSQLSQHQASTLSNPNSSSAAASSPTVAGASEAETTSKSAPSIEQGPVPISPISRSATGAPTTSDSPVSPTTPSTPAIGPGVDYNPSASNILQSSNIPSASSAAAATTAQPTTSTAFGSSSGPTVLITLILLNGKRHPFKIDAAYLRKRGVFKDPESSEDPFSITIYTLKDLIWRDWREEWEARPTVPGSIRLIHFGKLLEDKVLLKDMKLQPLQPNIFHMSVKPQDLVDEEENSKLKGGKDGSSRSRSRRGADGEDGESSAGCCSRCSIM